MSETKPKRNAAGHYLPGQSGNLSGRPGGARGLAKYVRGQVGNDMNKVVDALVTIILGQSSWATSNRDVIAAAKLLLAYGVGKPVERVEIASGDRDAQEWNVEKLSDGDLNDLHDWITRMHDKQIDPDAPAFETRH